MRADAKIPHHGNTGLHWAAYGAHAPTVRLLLDRGAPVDIRDDTYEATPLGWALHAWGHRSRLDPEEREGFYDTVAQLVAAGAVPDALQVSEEADRYRPARNVRSDPRMVAALRLGA